MPKFQVTWTQARYRALRILDTGEIIGYGLRWVRRSASFWGANAELEATTAAVVVSTRH